MVRTPLGVRTLVVKGGSRPSVLQVSAGPNEERRRALAAVLRQGRRRATSASMSVSASARAAILVCAALSSGREGEGKRPQKVIGA
ncbi:hypothetical protein B0H03_102203 [Rathayibacter iranicus NCPPB 2253 = VKM Ac-1602]|uniref:Uncharacterized protein n=1 Tax=Rathayibacter iranicus NCPPB 2253 = VKM Ac-1602 TaxID=1328868 RepID=A0ABX5LJB5_9MICO|nr:hypothetical protein B0H03_102203 [Rathayibacter iranicus NCPPB 2253 = VKM Ac-1602]